MSTPVGPIDSEHRRGWRIQQRAQFILLHRQSLPNDAGYRWRMSTPTIRFAYDMWPQYNRRMREVIGARCGELSQTLGIHGFPQIDLWRAD